ncbi:hypothetical protein CH373_18495, partial [Leptospira perolatii]
NARNPMHVIVLRLQKAVMDRRNRRRFFRKVRGVSFAGAKLALLALMVLDIALSPLAADPTLFRDLWKNGSDGKLERQYKKADSEKQESDWDQTVNQGKQLLRADWEANADREIEKQLLGVALSDQDAIREQLQKDKVLVLGEWETDVQREIDTRKGEWKAKVSSGSLEDLIGGIDKSVLFQAIVTAENASKAGTSATEKVSLFDASIAGALGAYRSDWETKLDGRIGGLAGSVSFGSDTEKTSFESSLLDIKKYIQAEYSYEESSILSAYRAQFVSRENESEDLQSRIAQETDPSQLAILLIARAKRTIDEKYSGILPPDGSVLTPPTSVVEGEDYQSKFLQALQDGQAQWQNAIDDLVLGKLKYDKAVERQWKNGEENWSEAFNRLLAARESWTSTIKAQIQKGLEAWDKSAADLQANRQKALGELDRTIETNRDQWQSHVRGIESVVGGGADTLSTIVANKQFFKEALDRANVPGSGYGTNIKTEYQNQLNYWTGLETRIRNLVASAQNQIHDEDIRGTSVGKGLLYNAGGSDTYIYSSAELELKIAKEELKVLQQKKDRAQEVY